MPYQEPTPRIGFIGRLAKYLIGVAIGCMVLGFFQLAKQRQAKIDEAHRQQLKTLPPADDKLFPPMPRADKPAPGSSGASGGAPSPSPVTPAVPGHPS